MFIERTRTALGELTSRRLDDIRLAVMMLDGLEIAERTHVVALGISTDGVQIPLGLWEGSTENATLARTLLADLVARGLDPDQAILFVIDGGKALGRAIKDVFGEHALVHRLQRHKERNVCDPLPERDGNQVRARIRAAWALTDAELAEQRLQLLAGERDRAWPDAAASLREGTADTLPLMRLGIARQLASRTATCASAGPPPACSSPSSSSGGSSATATSPSSHRDRASRHPHRPEGPGPSGGRRARYRLTVNPPGSPSKFHDDPDTS